MNQSEPLRSHTEDEFFEQQLLKVMQPVDAPEGFADRTLARIGQPPRALKNQAPGKLLSMPMHRRWTVGAIAATILAGAFAGQAVHQHRQRERDARRQFELALEITDRTLQHTRTRLGRAGIELGD